MGSLHKTLVGAAVIAIVGALLAVFSPLPQLAIGGWCLCCGGLIVVCFLLGVHHRRQNPQQHLLGVPFTLGLIISVVLTIGGAVAFVMGISGSVALSTLGGALVGCGCAGIAMYLGSGRGYVPVDVTDDAPVATAQPTQPERVSLRPPTPTPASPTDEDADAPKTTETAPPASDAPATTEDADAPTTDHVYVSSYASTLAEATKVTPERDTDATDDAIPTERGGAVSAPTPPAAEPPLRTAPETIDVTEKRLAAQTPSRHESVSAVDQSTRRLPRRADRRRARAQSDRAAQATSPTATIPRVGKDTTAS
ncbi:hypothetical protein H8R18_00975 [Nanchangia anserum]|uniref:Uncharacterized protein n=1 Tax=Nanchangia anserum TaxID=2692125 RepID=A0A8I0KWA5_9ACTO|nr:hypothetical protein [Nanchangia anserum]MBD3689814.1 hypothetical protein [Nanchangia anserum]QOX81983.1 hypothetical protein H8R18_00975 [Nanchangia anserum]